MLAKTLQYVVVFSLILIITQSGLPSFELLAVIEELKDSNGSTESCVYDSQNDLWRLWDSKPWKDGESDFIKGAYPGRDFVYFSGSPAYKRTFRQNRGDPLGTDGALGTVFVPGPTDDNDGIVYIVDSDDSVIIPYNVSTSINDYLGTKKTSISIPDSIGINGICYDENDNMLYVTNPGIDFNVFPPITKDVSAAIWSIDIDNNLSVQKVYDGSTDSIKDQNGNIAKDSTYSSGGNRVFHPNGCTLKDGMVYMVEIRPDLTGSLGIYDINRTDLTIDTDVLKVAGDGLVHFDNYLIASSWGSFDSSQKAGTLLYYDADRMNEFEIGITGLVSPSDIGMNPYGVICIPSYTSGDISFVRFRTKLSGFKVLPQIFDMTAAAGYNAYSFVVAYDDKRESFVFINDVNSDTTNGPDIHEIDADYAGGIVNDGFIGSNNGRTSVIPYSGYIPKYYRGEIVHNTMYVIDALGYLLAIDLETDNVINYIEIVDYPQENGGLHPFVTGMCIDPDDTAMIYIQTINDIYSVDVSNNTIGGWIVDIIYKYRSPISDQNDENVEFWGLVFADCTVYDGKVYMVQDEEIGSSRYLGIYDVENETIHYNPDLLNSDCASITSSPTGILIVAEEKTGQILATRVPDNEGIEEMMPFQIVAIDVANIINNVQGYILQITTDFINGVVAIAAYDESKLGYLYFIQSNDLIPEQYEKPTTSQSPDDSATTTEVITTSEQETTSSTITETKSSSFIVLTRIFDMTEAAVESGAPLSDYSFSYVIAYDGNRQNYAFINQHASDSQNIPDVHEIDANWASDERITDYGFIGTDYQKTSVIPTSTGFVPFYFKAEIVNDIMYVIDIYGYLLAIDLETENVINYIEFGVYPNGGTSKYITGICIDPDNISKIYITGSNGDIYVVDVNSNILGEWTMNIIYNGGTQIYDENGENPENNGFISYDCTVYNGKIYLIQNENDNSNYLGIYNIENNILYYNSNILNLAAISITSSSNGILIIAQQNSGKILCAQVPDNESIKKMIPFQVIASDIAMVINGVQGNILQITIDPINGVVAIAVDEEVNHKGYIYFIQSDDIITQKNITKQGTQKPDEISSTLNNNKNRTTTKGINYGSTTKGTNSTKDANKANQNILNRKYIVLLILFSLYYSN